MWGRRRGRETGWMGQGKGAEGKGQGAWGRGGGCGQLYVHAYVNNQIRGREAAPHLRRAAKRPSANAALRRI